MKRVDVITAGLVIVGVFGLLFAGQVVSQVRFAPQSDSAVAVGSCHSQFDPISECRIDEIKCVGTHLGTPPPGPCGNSRAPVNTVSAWKAKGVEAIGENYVNVSTQCPSTALKTCDWFRVGTYQGVAVYDCEPSGAGSPKQLPPYDALGGSC